MLVACSTGTANEGLHHTVVPNGGGEPAGRLARAIEQARARS